MLMADMTESERQTVRELNVHWLPDGAELLEIVDMLWSGWECDHAMSLLRMPDGSVRLQVIGGTAHPDNEDPIGMLEKRAAAYEAAIEDTRRFIGIARTALGQAAPDGPWACSSCGRAFHDPQPVCPACGEPGNDARVDEALEQTLLAQVDRIAEAVRYRDDLRGKRYTATAAVQLLWPGRKDAAVLLELQDGGRAAIRAGDEPRGSNDLVVGMLRGQLEVHRDMMRRVQRFLARVQAEGLGASE